MDRNQIFEKIKKYFIDEFEVPSEKITIESRLFEELGLDSLDALDMIGMLEAELNIKVVEEELKQIRVISDVVDYVEKYA